MAFEVRTFKDGHWLTEYVTEDRMDALNQAKVLCGRKRYTAVKVVAETYDESANIYHEKIIYNSNKILGAAPAPPPPDDNIVARPTPRPVNPLPGLSMFRIMMLLVVALAILAAMKLGRPIL